MSDDLVTWLHAQLDEDERVAREASRRDEDGFSPAGEHWHWVEPRHDQILTLDPMLDEYLNDGGQAALRSVEEYPTNMPYTLPHFVVSYAEGQRTVDAMHIARWDPARVLAEVDAKRRILDHIAGRLDPRDDAEYAWESINAETDGMATTTLRLLALPYADREGYRPEWRPA